MTGIPPFTTTAIENGTDTQMQFFERGWCQFDFDANIKRWVDASLPYARAAVQQANNQKWLRCGGTWFAGVNSLPNQTDSSLPGGPILSGAAIDFIHHILQLRPFNWDRGQISVCYPQYPQPMPSESATAFRFRRYQDAAHIDGLLPEGPKRRRHLREHHAFILGIPMLEHHPQASPPVVWEGSPALVYSALHARFKNQPPDTWGEADITDTYHAVREQIFRRCGRVPLWGQPGEVFLIHRLALHGISPWQSAATATTHERMICYFRPEIGDAAAWLHHP